MTTSAVRRSLLVFVATLTLGSLAVSAQQAVVAPTEIATDIRKHLQSLPYYGVYDLLTFNVDSTGSVTLAGYVLNGSLKSDAEREVREVKGIKDVQNRIALAPVFPMDDEIRHAVYHAVYGDPALSRYGTPDSELRSMRPGFHDWGAGFGGRGFGGPRLMNAPFYGYDPVGSYAIHILVNNRTVTLAGVVDSESDKTLVGLKTRGVANVTEVNNELAVPADKP